MMKNQPRTKQQHFVPRMHLANFVGNEPTGHVWTYNIQDETVRSSIPEGTGKQGNFYTVTDFEGNHHDELETWLSGVEAKATEPYKKLLKGEIPQGQERADFSTFLSSMYARSPVMLKNYGQMMGQSTQLINQVATATLGRFEMSLRQSGQADLSPEEIKATYEFAKDTSNYTINVDHQATLPAIGVSDKLQEIFFNMTWSILSSEEQHLITSDNPVVRVVDPKTYHPIYGDHGFMNKTATVTFPLSPKYCLHLAWGAADSPFIFPIKKQLARLFNKHRAYFCDKYLYANCKEEGLMKLGAKYKNHGLQLKIGGANDDFAEVVIERKMKDRKEKDTQ